jgi:MFS family permease
LDETRIPRTFWFYVVTRFCAATAMRLLSSAVLWQVYAMTSSAFALGLVGLVQFIPASTLTLYGGTIADAYDRRTIMRLAQLPMIASVALLGWATHRGAVSVPMLYAVMFVVTASFSFDSPARQALVPNLVPIEAFPRAITFAATALQLGFVTGPALGGLLLASRWGVEAAYVLYVVLVTLNLIGIGFLRPVRETAGRRAPSWSAVREGIAFVSQKPLVWGCMTLDMFAVIFGGATALLPVFAKDILMVAERGYGLLLSSLEIGALLTAIVMMIRRPVSRAGPALLTAVAVYGLATIVFGFSRAYPLSIAAYMVAGMADQVSVVMRQTTIQLATPDALRGRVSSVNMIAIAASNQLGAMESGFVAAATSPTFAVVSGGIGCLVVLAIVMWRVPELRRHRTEALLAVG